MKRYLVVLCWLGLFCQNSHANTNNDSTNRPNKLLKVSFLNLIDPFNPSLSLFYEHHAGNRLNFEHEAGYLIGGGVGYKDNTQGFRYRGMVKNYFGKKRSTAKEGFKDYMYVGLSFMYQEKITPFSGFYQVYETDENGFERPVYQRNISYKEVTEKKAIALNYGYIVNISQSTNFEFSMGVGKKWFSNKIRQAPANFTPEPQTFFLDDNSNFQSLINHFTIGWKVGFIL